jgi:glycerate kinase
MKIVIAPNAFKGFFTAREAARSMAAGARRACPEGEIVCLPVSDGGDGLVEIMEDALWGEIVTREVRDPLGRPVKARLLWVDGQAVIEMAEASGMALLNKSELDPMRSSTYGTGQLIRHALDLGARRLLVGIGGSATCDGGTGMASALGVRFLDARGRVFEPTGGSLHEIACIEKRPALDEVEIDAACDVSNRLLGEEGAARVYAPQKGASPEQVEALEKGLKVLAERIRIDLGIDVTGLAGGGAAGGLGAGLFAFLGARLRPGADLVLEHVGLSSAIREADLVITGEGRLDDQTLAGKAPARVAALCREQRVPCYAVAGEVAVHAGFDRAFSLKPEGITLEQAAYRAVMTFTSSDGG